MISFMERKKEEIKSIPWNVTPIRLPPILQITKIMAAIVEATESGFDIRARRRVVNRVRVVVNPSSIKDVTISCMNFLI